MDRAEHLAWAKERALAYLPDVTNATASFVSDLGKHEELADNIALSLIGMHIATGNMDVRACRQLIEGTN